MDSLTSDEIRKILVCVDNKRDGLLIQMGLTMGCRVSEICSIETKNIKPNGIKIWDEKKDCYREVVLDSDTSSLLQVYLEHDWKPKQHQHHKLFYFSPKTANRIFKRWCEKAVIEKKKAHWHTLRHTYIIHSLDADVPLNYICSQTGDTPNTVINVYGMPSWDKRVEMINQKGRYWK